jgi:cytochrome c553
VRAPLLALLITGLAAACSRPAPEAGRAFSATGEVIALSGGEAGPTKACFTCHGLDGHGDGASIPRLAGLDAGYLQKQMEDYAASLRPDKVMVPIAKQLTAEDRRAVALYYAGLPASGENQMEAEPAPAAYGACAACHGAQGEGVGAGNPALAGQPARLHSSTSSIAGAQPSVAMILAG